MKYLLFILTLSFLLAGELEVEGDLKVTGTIENSVIELLQQQIAELQAQITSLQEQLGLAEIGVIFDIDGNLYTTVEITGPFGSQLWMGENLKTTRYRNGDSILYASDGDESLLSGNPDDEAFYTVYDFDETYASTYGYLYNAHVVNDSREVCPAGWHVPTDEEFAALEVSLGMCYGSEGNFNQSGSCTHNTDWRNSGDVGNKLKVEEWNGNNESGFSAIGSGSFLVPNGGYFASLNIDAVYWTSSPWPNSNNENLTRELNEAYSGVYRTGRNHNYGYSIRCVAD